MRGGGHTAIAKRLLIATHKFRLTMLFGLIQAFLQNRPSVKFSFTEKITSSKRKNFISLGMHFITILKKTYTLAVASFQTGSGLSYESREMKSSKRNPRLKISRLWKRTIGVAVCVNK